jgi:hypothetical protein
MPVMDGTSVTGAGDTGSERIAQPARQDRTRRQATIDPRRMDGLGLSIS